MNRHPFGAATATAAVFGLMGSVTFAQTVQTTQTETTHHEETTTNHNGDQTSTSQTSHTVTTSQTGAPPTAPVPPPSDIHRTGFIPWSSASTRPGFSASTKSGLYIWHDKNTVYLSTVGDPSGPHVWDGSIDITNGRFDTVKNISAGADDHFNQEAQNRITFHLPTGARRDTFKFNLRSGGQLRLHATEDGQKSTNIFVGGAMAQAQGDPVVFDVNR